MNELVLLEMICTSSAAFIYARLFPYCFKSDLVTITKDSLSCAMCVHELVMDKKSSIVFCILRLYPIPSASIQVSGLLLPLIHYF